MRLIGLLFAFMFTLYGDVVHLEEGVNSLNIVPHSRYFVEQNRSYTPQTVLTQSPLFQRPEYGIYNFGFVDKPIWILFDISSPPVLSSQWILRIDNPHIDEYALYRIDASGPVLLSKNGDTLRSNAPPESRTFWEPLSTNGGEASYLLRIQTKGALQIPLFAETLSEAYHSESMSNLLFGLYYGVLLLLLVYNLVLYAIVKDIHYFNYLLFLGSYMLFQLSFDGVGREWVWPGSVWMSNNGIAFFIMLTAIFGFRFARYFLVLKRYAPGAERLVLFAEAISFIGALLALLLDYHTAITFAALWSAFVPWLLIYAGFMVQRHYRAARYYLAGWIVFLLATIIVASNKLGFIPSSPILLFAQQIGSLIQMVLLSFALADRINMMKIEHLAKLRVFNDKLQASIKTKIDELRQKDRLMIQQSRLAAMGEMIENIAHQWRQPLNQLSLIQSSLFFEHQLGTLDDEKIQKYQEQSESMMEYMTQTIDDFRNFFLSERDKSTFDPCESVQKALELLEPTLRRHDIRVELACNGNPGAYGHENEFSQVIINIINNAKDAMLEHSVQAPTIRITISDGDALSRIRICDNGGGVDPKILDKIFDPYFTTKFQSQGTGIGLYMVKMIMEKSMNGRIEVENNYEGACFLLTLPAREPKESYGT